MIRCRKRLVTSNENIQVYRTHYGGYTEFVQYDNNIDYLTHYQTYNTVGFYYQNSIPNKANIGLQADYIEIRIGNQSYSYPFSLYWKYFWAASVNLNKDAALGVRLLVYPTFSLFFENKTFHNMTSGYSNVFSRHFYQTYSGYAHLKITNLKKINY